MCVCLCLPLSAIVRFSGSYTNEDGVEYDEEEDSDEEDSDAEE